MAKQSVDSLKLDLRKESSKGQPFNMRAVWLLLGVMIVLVFFGIQVNKWVNSDKAANTNLNNNVISERDVQAVGQEIATVKYQNSGVNYTTAIKKEKEREQKKLLEAKEEAVTEMVRSGDESANNPESTDNNWGDSFKRPARKEPQNTEESLQSKEIALGLRLPSQVSINFGEFDSKESNNNGGDPSAQFMQQMMSGISSPQMAVAQPAGNEVANQGQANMDQIMRGLQQKDRVVAQNLQNEKQNYIDSENEQFVNSGMLQSAPSPYMVRAGDAIPVVLLRGVNTDLPGSVMAMVERDVYDSITGQHLLIPKMSVLRGSYQSVLSYGQERILTVWNRLDLPNGDRIALDKFTAADLQGFAGFKGEVDRHTLATVTGAFLSSVLSVGAAAGQDPYGEVSAGDVAKRGIADASSQVGEQYVDRMMNRQNTLTAIIGKRFVIDVNKDLLLKPYTPPR
jgi:type IV secretion system protein VirB10